MLKPSVFLQSAFHREKQVIKIIFERNEEVLMRIRSLNKVLWSQTLRAWYLPDSEGIVETLKALLGELAEIDQSGLLRQNIIEKKEAAKPVNDELVIDRQPKRNQHIETKLSGVLSVEQEEKIKAFKNWMNSRRYSENTIGTYTDALRTFLRFYANKPIQEINNEDVIVFNNEYIIKNKLSSSFQNQVVNAIKLFFRTIELKRMETELIHRPKRAHVLPNVLSKQEVKKILGAHNNIKHKTMLSLIYSCGLRRGELLNLKLGDIDSKRGLIIVRQAKGKKDRVVPLSEKILVMLRDYYLACKPKVWLFEGQDGTGKYDERSLASVLKHALEKAKIDKPVTLHWLRHSYATHLLENGTDLRYIQEILGHSRSTTTEIYTHVSTKGIQNVVSPFDSL